MSDTVQLIEGFALDLARGCLTRDGVQVHLRPQTYDVFTYLVENRGRLISKDKLIERVWRGRAVTDGSLGKCIEELREALGQNGMKYIRNVRGRGYIFDFETNGAPGEIENSSGLSEQIDILVANEEEESGPKHLAEIIRRHKLGVAIASLLLLAAGGELGYWFFAGRSTKSARIDSIAVLPFRNESGDPEVEYLSDGMTESLINGLSRLPRVSVKPRNSVFRYKGKEAEPQRIASELSVQAILSGRLVQRGDTLTLYLSLVDARDGNQIWGKQYNRTTTDLVSLQTEIVRDVSQKLRTPLSSAESHELGNNYTENAEAYQLYLKGRYHVLKLTRPETEKALSYFQQAIDIDRNYALAYVGLANAYRALALTGDMPSTQFLPKAKTAAQRAIEIDASLAEAHAQLAYMTFWYDWDWNTAEKECKRALELDPNSAEAHDACAHVFSSTGRHIEALAEIGRAKKLDPVNLRISALEAEFLIHAGRADEALESLQKTFELDTNFWFAHLFASSAYIEKGMFAEAILEARRASELSKAQTLSVALEGYALAKAGKRDEARTVLAGLRKLSKDQFVPSYTIAMIYNGLGERDETIAWLERGYAERDPRMTFLRVEPKWNNLRDDPRFQDLLRRVGLTP